MLTVLYGCNKMLDSVDDCSLKDSFPLQTGNWWVYEGYDTDMNNTKISQSDFRDSVVVTGTTIMYGKTCYILERNRTYTGDTTQKQVIYLALENGQVYRTLATFTTLTSNMEDCICPPDRWIKIADCSMDKWNIYYNKKRESRRVLVIKNSDGKYDIEDVLTEYTYSLRAWAEPYKQLDIGNKSYMCRQFTTRLDMTGQILEPDSVQYVGNPNMIIQENMFTANGIGIVKWEIEPVFEEGGDQMDDLYIEGWTEHLVNYSIK